MSVERQLHLLRSLVLDARAVPMSASCMMNRQETVEMIDAMLNELYEELFEARQIVADRDRQTERGRYEGDRIRNEAEEWAQQTANNTEIVRRAEARAKQIMDDAIAESSELRLETDAFVDQRMAEFEAALQKTESQVKLMRARLASRSELDGDETQQLPRL